MYGINVLTIPIIPTADTIYSKINCCFFAIFYNHTKWKKGCLWINTIRCHFNVEKVPYWYYWCSKCQYLTQAWKYYAKLRNNIVSFSLHWNVVLVIWNNTVVEYQCCMFVVHYANTYTTTLCFWHSILSQTICRTNKLV